MGFSAHLQTFSGLDEEIRWPMAEPIAAPTMLRCFPRSCFKLVRFELSSREVDGDSVLENVNVETSEHIELRLAMNCSLCATGSAHARLGIYSSIGAQARRRGYPARMLRG